MAMTNVRIGTRGSALALAQTEQVEQRLAERYPGIHIERIIFKTKGDRNQKTPLAELGGNGVFVGELEHALAEGEIDLAVHSAKDMPVRQPSGLYICGVLPRGDVRDVLVCKNKPGDMMEVLRKPSRKENALSRKPDIHSEGRTAGKNYFIGTSSPRRAEQLKRLYPDFICRPIRGNVPTRLAKVLDGTYDGVILAAAGLKRLGILNTAEIEEDGILDAEGLRHWGISGTEGLFFHYFSEEEMLPAGGQAIIAIEGRKGDEASELAEGITDPATALELDAERRVLSLLDAGCHEPVAVRARAVRSTSGNGVQGEKMFVEITAFSAADGRFHRVSMRDDDTGQWKELAELAVSELMKK